MFQRYSENTLQIQRPSLVGKFETWQLYSSLYYYYYYLILSWFMLAVREKVRMVFMAIRGMFLYQNFLKKIIVNLNRIETGMLVE